MSDMVKKTKLLYLCTGNSCRSQMAEAWTRALKADRIEAFSAGTAPHGLDSRAVKAMAECGIDIAAQASKHVDSLAGMEFDYVVTLCENARETCPFFPARVRVLHIPFDDPPAAAASLTTEEEILQVYRRVRDEIRRFVETLPGSLPAFDESPP